MCCSADPEIIVSRVNDIHANGAWQMETHLMKKLKKQSTPYGLLSRPPAQHTVMVWVQLYMTSYVYVPWLYPSGSTPTDLKSVRLYLQSQPC